MRIGIDANWAIYEKAGIGKYSENLIKNLLKYDTKNEYVLFFNFFFNQGKHQSEIKNLIKDSKKKVTVKFVPLPGKVKEFLFQTKLPASSIYSEKIDLYFSPYFGGIPQNGWEKMVVTIHDLVFLKFPSHAGKDLSKFYLKKTREAVDKCQKIIAVSEATRKDLIKLLKTPEEKIQVIYEGRSEEFKPIKDQKTINTRLKKYGLSYGEFILSVGTLEPRKNLVSLIKAYAQLSMTIKNKYKLVLVGGAGWNNSEIDQKIQDLNLKDKIIKTGYVEQADLPYFYNAAKVFVYPSLYEGFGLPVLEAESCGTPVITSSISSLPEVTGNAAILVKPKEESEIAAALKKVLNSEKERNFYSRAGLSQARRFSWEKTAKETIKLFNKI